MKSGEFWEIAGWIKRGKQRVEVIKILPDNPITTEEFRKDFNSKTSFKLSLREMSRHLTSFTKRGLIKCLTPDAPYGRIYQLTRRGRLLKKNMISKKLL